MKFAYLIVRKRLCEREGCRVFIENFANIFFAGEMKRQEVPDQTSPMTSDGNDTIDFSEWQHPVPHCL